MDDQRRDVSHTTSTGFDSSEVGWLDDHFAMARPEYEAQLRAVGIQPGWRVLDAGSGGGGYLPWLADLVGPTGAIVALDLTPENVAALERRVAALALPCPVAVRLGDVTALPYPAAHFDAVWCANVSQYLDDARLRTALAEFRRVVRPGGLVAVKESTGPIPFYPLPPVLLLRLLAAAGSGADVMGNIVRVGHGRNPFLRRWLEGAGLVAAWQRLTPIERWAPFTPLERRMAVECVGLFAALAARCDLSQEDRAAWARASDLASPAHLANAPDGYMHEGNVLAVGRVP